MTSKTYDYYRTRFRAIEFQVLFRQRLFERLQLMAGPYFYHYWNKYSDKQIRVLGKPSI